MSELFNSIKLKEKITIITPMVTLAVILATLIGVLSFYTADRHAHVYDYTLEKNGDSFTLRGVCNVPNCENPFLKEENLSGVKLLSAVSPTCSSKGEKKYSYTHNGVTVNFVEEVDALPHIYEYELTSNGGVTSIEGDCTLSGCTEHVSDKNISEFKVVSEIKGDCFIAAQVTYSYVVNGVTKTIVTVSDERDPHTLAGVSADTLENSDGTYNAGISGVMVYASYPYACGTVVKGSYVCEKCKQIIEIDVRYPEHNFVYSASNVVNPTFESDGCASLTCKNTLCTDVLDIIIPKVELGNNTVTVVAPTEKVAEVVRYSFVSNDYGFKIELDFTIGTPLSHNYVYHIEPDPNNSGKIDLVGICSQPECENSVIREKDIDAEFTDTSTCQSKGMLIWTYVKDGEVLEFKASTNDVGDHKFVYESNRVLHPNMYIEGFAELYCSYEGCHEVVTINLPKVELGVNTVITGTDEKGNSIAEYTYYAYNYRCKIILSITIYNVE